MHSPILKSIPILLLFNFLSARSQNTYVPDDNFEQALIDQGFDTPPLDDYVSTATISNIKVLYLQDLEIMSLEGIQDFSALEYLDCTGNLLTTLNISNNLKIRELFCRYNQLSDLDVSNNTDLELIWCEFNEIRALDVSLNTKLSYLSCHNNPIDQLDVTKNPVLERLNCGETGISYLDVTQNPDLKSLTCSYNFLTELNISKNPDLIDLYCSDNLLKALDITQNQKLQHLYAMRNFIPVIDPTNNPKLLDLGVSQNPIKILDVSQNPELEILLCSENLLTELDVSGNPSIWWLSCHKNQISSLDLSNLSGLIRFTGVKNGLCYLNVQNGYNANIERFQAEDNPDLRCIYVDDPDYSEANWTGLDSTARFVSTEKECNDYIDSFYGFSAIEDFKGESYFLPPLAYGNYYSQPNGQGQQLAAGDHISTSQTVYIYEETACYTLEDSFLIDIDSDGDGSIIVPNFFSPNRDGINDSWKLTGDVAYISQIVIFNRYGKLLKLLPSGLYEWNGTYNGHLMPEDDYWYVIHLTDGKQLKGHFSLLN